MQVLNDLPTIRRWADVIRRIQSNGGRPRQEPSRGVSGTITIQVSRKGNKHASPPIHLKIVNFDI